jgi:hypothetical protein
MDASLDDLVEESSRTSRSNTSSGWVPRDRTLDPRIEYSNLDPLRPATMTRIASLNCVFAVGQDRLQLAPFERLADYLGSSISRGTPTRSCDDRGLGLKRSWSLDAGGAEEPTAEGPEVSSDGTKILVGLPGVRIRKVVGAMDGTRVVHVVTDEETAAA